MGTSKDGRALNARLDHLFVLTDSEAQASIPAAAGFSVYRRGPHRGGGTGNVVYRFREALLELAYPLDQDEIAALGAIGFAERWRWRENGYAPFGVVFQIAGSDASTLPFETWEYAPPFLPETRWTLAQAPPQEPLYMLAPFAEERTCNHADPALASIHIACPGIETLSHVARTLAESGVCQIAAGAPALLELSFSGSALATLDLRPHVPLVLRNESALSVTDARRDGF